MKKNSDLALVVEKAECLLADSGVRLTLGAEPTFVPLEPNGAEWSHAALGPEKLGCARRMAASLLQGKMRGGFAILSPGKLYPGEANPRWNLRVVCRKDRKPFFPPPPPAPDGKAGPAPREFARAVTAALGLKGQWVAFRDPHNAGHEVLAAPLDCDGGRWATAAWPLPPARRELLPVEGPAGLRLPLNTLPPSIPRRVLTISRRGRAQTVFFPPLHQEPFLQLLEIVTAAAARLGMGDLEFEGYLPGDELGLWHVLNLTPDPGVLEVNLPPCANWREFCSWMRAVARAAGAAGLRSWKPGAFSEGTGGGCHLLWGSPVPGESPFFTRPAWLASVLEFWQAHPSLSYLFTGAYVGPSSQAPRPDESGHAHHDLELAAQFLRSLPPGDHRAMINEALRHLHTDASGNTHRSEISFDKFWNPGWPGGGAGLLEFRAIETMPKTAWMEAVAALWTCLAAALLREPRAVRMRRHGRALHDRFFLPACILADFEEVLRHLAACGLPLPPPIFREIWEWRFPVLLKWGGDALVVRRALEIWPLLSETPLEGGVTSRFVDASLRRIEISCAPEFAREHLVTINGREAPVTRTLGGRRICGIRFRATRLRPSLHPGILPHVPLRLRILERASLRPVAEFEIASDSSPATVPFTPAAADSPAGRPLRPISPSDWTLDLRF